MKVLKAWLRIPGLAFVFFLFNNFSVFTGSARLSVFPNVCNLDPITQTCHVEISYETYDGTNACVFVYDQNASVEKLMMCNGPSGRDYPQWISKNPLEFRLRAGDTSSAPLLAAAQAVGISVSPQLSQKALESPFVQRDGLPTPRSSGLAGFWDGRLFLNAVSVFQAPDQSQPTRYGWTVFLMRPEAASEPANKSYLASATDLFKIPDLYSSEYLLDTDNAAPGNPVNCPPRFGNSCANWGTNRAQITGRLQLAPFPDPAFSVNPFPSDASGNYDAGGAYATYRFYVVATAALVGALDVGKLGKGLYTDMNYLTLAPGQVIVQNPKTPTASIYSAQILAPASALSDSAGNPIIGKEPSASLDGRMITYGANSHQFDPNYNQEMSPAESEYFTFNALPGRPFSWSPAATLPDAYFRYGPGRPGGEVKVAGLNFSRRFPFASCPMLDYAGKPMETSALGMPMQGGAYNWISPDASEVFTGVMPNWYGPARRGWTMVGRRTGCKLVYIDSSMNPVRGIPLGQEVFNYDPTLKADLQAAYDKMPQPNAGGVPVPHSYENVLPSANIIYPGAWNPWQGIPNLPIPENREKEVYGLAFSGSHLYAEAPIPDNQADLVLDLPMNELLSYDEALAYNYAYTPNYRWTHGNHWRTTYDVNHTPDLSRYSQNGTLMNGAQFPFEFNDAEGTWSRTYAAGNGVILDSIDGARGNSIFMPNGAYVEVPLAPKALAQISRARKYTVSFWTRMQSANPATLFQLPGLLNISVDGNGNYKVVQMRNDGVQTVSNVPVPSIGWNHLAVVNRIGNASIYVNGQLMVMAPYSGAFGAPGSPLLIGPQAGAAGNRVDMDEVLVYATALDDEEIARLAFRKSTESENPGVATGLHRNLSNQAAVAKIPLDNPFNSSPAALALGRTLFQTTSLSASKTISCASCHKTGSFSDTAPVSIGVNGPGIRNTPALIDLAFATTQFFDGSASMLETQALHPIMSGEFGADLSKVPAILNADPSFKSQFNAVYGKPADLTLIARSLANFVRSLTAGNAAFDTGTLDASQRNGLELFRGKANCIACHSGPDFTDHQIHDTGLPLSPTALLPQGDLGAFWIQGSLSGVAAFKTPSLRNVANTGPYFHDGRCPNLGCVVNFYNRGGDIVSSNRPSRDSKIRPLNLSMEEEGDLIHFLRSLSAPLAH